MPVNIRVEVSREQQGLITEEGFVPFSRMERKQARERTGQAIKDLGLARRDRIYHEARYPKVVTFGSARMERGSDEFNYFSDLTKALVEARKMDIVSGGGPGSMEAALEGVFRAKQAALLRGEVFNAIAYGNTISTLSGKGEDVNQFVERELQHDEFSTRLQDFMDISNIGAYIGIGAIGSLLEFATIAQAKQVGHLEPEYVVVADLYWEGLVDSMVGMFYTDRLKHHKKPLMNEGDLSFIHFTDKIPKIVDLFSKRYDEWEKNFHPYIRKLP